MHKSIKELENYMVLANYSSITSKSYVSAASNQEAWEYFYPNGIMMAKGKFEEFGKGKVRYYTGQRTPKDEWNYWNESGNKIAKMTYKKP